MHVPLGLPEEGLCDPWLVHDTFQVASGEAVDISEPYIVAKAAEMLGEENSLHG